MTIHGLVLAVVASSAVLAAWLHLRRDGKMPDSGKRIALHAGAALATTAAVPLIMRQARTDQSATAAMVTLFTLVVPMFVYNFLTWLWLIKLLQRHLRVG
jgi:ABC-type amino acid transport system permease subunit